MHKVTESKEIKEEGVKPPIKVVRKSSLDRESLLYTYKKHAEDNEIEIVQSKRCGCFFCRQVYDARTVQEWIDDERGVTALCPECGMDAVIGDASGIEITKPLMKEMNLLFFGEAYMESNPEAAKTYCTRYRDGKIAHKEKSEAFYVHYLSLLEDAGDPISSLALADLYFYGSEFTERNVKEALFHYGNRSLSSNQKALCGLGRCHLELVDEEDNYKKAFIAFSKAAGLGSMEAVYLMADCFDHGYFVPSDPSFAFQLVDNAYNEALALFVIDRVNWFDYPELAFQLAKYYETGRGVAKDEEMALKLYLLAELSTSLRATFLGFERNPKLNADAKKAIELLGKRHRLVKNPMVYDVDTFEDSIPEQALSHEERTISNVGWNEEENALEFDVTYPYPSLLVDIGNLTAGFVTGTVRWRFKDVANYKLSSENHFTRVSGNYDDGFSFSYENEEGDEVSIFEVYFRSDKKEGEDK